MIYAVKAKEERALEGQDNFTGRISQAEQSPVPPRLPQLADHLGYQGVKYGNQV